MRAVRCKVTYTAWYADFKINWPAMVCFLGSQYRCGHRPGVILVPREIVNTLYNLSSHRIGFSVHPGKHKVVRDPPTSTVPGSGTFGHATAAATGSRRLRKVAGMKTTTLGQNRVATDTFYNRT
jgi:hypothetical protein